MNYLQLIPYLNFSFLKIAKIFYKLKNYILNYSFFNVVRYYIKTRDILDRYHHEPSFQGIRDDCQIIISELCKILKEKFNDPEVSVTRIHSSSFIQIISQK